MAKIINNFLKFDIRKILIERIKVIKTGPLIQKANVSPSKMSRFLCERGGMDFHSGIRVLIVAGYKILDENGDVVLGDPRRKDQELKDNTLISVDL